ncbi:MAG: efflux RND transporter periplasmic adaptor subunit [Tannerellaceae bacterium]|jgi:RND family efflux transporter MFP subunit|nr:efflux RND transporter periplasmic adaptor subunit [Tannerellaceae bacterium]
MKLYIIELFVVLTTLLTGCNSGSQKEDEHHHGEETGSADEIVFSPKQAELVGLTTEIVSPGVFYQVINTSGQIQASQGDEAVIVATSNGIVSFTNPSITDGALISAGQSIVTISAKKLLEGDPAIKSKIAYETALKEYQRAEGLIKEQIISAKEFEQIKSRYETAKTTYEAQASNMTETGVSVTSPISGYIKNRFVAQGEYVSVGQPVATVSKNKRLQLRAEVPERNFKMLKSINSANFKPAYENTVYKLSDLNGRLLSYGKASGDQTFYIPVTFEFDNIGDIIPGTFTEVYLLSGPQENVVSVPISSVTEEQGLNFVYLRLDEEGYKKQEVILGQNNGERVQILSGLKEGDEVVVKGVYQVKLAATSSVMPEGHSH